MASPTTTELAGSKLLSALNLEELEQAAPLFSLRSYPKGAVLVLSSLVIDARGSLRGAAQTILPATGDQGEAGGRAHARFRIATRKQHALLRKAIEIGRDVRRAPLRVTSAEAAKIGVAEIVGQDVDEVRPARIRLSVVFGYCQ